MIDVINVLMIGPDLKAQGGMATVEQNIFDAVRARGGHAEFVSTYAEGGKASKFVIAARAYARYMRMLRNCDLVHVHMASRGSYERKKIFIRTAFKRGLPVVLHLHGSEFGVWFSSECTDMKRDEIRATFKACAKVIVLSEEWRAYIVENEICDPTRIVVLHNSVYLPEKNTTDYACKQVLFLGRLGERKSPDTLLRAAVSVLESHPDATFVFGGDGDIERYRALASELGIGARCSFTGWVTGEERERLFDRSSIFCLPSRNEGMPMSALEAMAHGLATIATPVGGVPQVIEDGVDGLMVTVGDHEALAKALCSLMDDVEMRKRVGRMGREKVRERFSMNTYLSKVIEIYEGVAQ